jgi:hypothetical protein
MIIIYFILLFNYDNMNRIRWCFEEKEQKHSVTIVIKFRSVSFVNNIF